MRLDKYLSENFGSRTKAAEAIEKGLVKVNGKAVSPSYEFKEGDEITFGQAEEHFVSNGGYKLSKAIKDFDLDVTGKIFADIGASNGGFTDCLLQHGAGKVYCIDVGESQLDKSLLDKNVVIMDNFNARNLSHECFSETVDGAVIDVSFISLTYVLKNACDVISDDGIIVALIKPQFECESKRVGKNGIVKDPSIHKKVINKIFDFAQSIGLSVVNITNAPIIKGKNMEYLVLLSKKQQISVNICNINKYVKL